MANSAWNSGWTVLADSEELVWISSQSGYIPPLSGVGIVYMFLLTLK